MKQGKALTREQKILLSNAGWNPKERLLIRNGENTMILRSKVTGELSTFLKGKEDGR